MIFAIVLGAGSLALHLAGLLALDRWHRLSARSSTARNWHALTPVFVSGLILLHLLGAVLFAIAYWTSGAVASMNDALVASISYHATASVPIVFNEDVGALRAAHGLVAWATFALSLVFLIRFEQTRPDQKTRPDRAHR